MEGVSNNLLQTWEGLPHVSEQITYNIRQEIDRDITALIRTRLRWDKPESEAGDIILEDDAALGGYGRKGDRVTWIGDAVDNTKGYLESRHAFEPDLNLNKYKWGSGLMAVDGEGNVIASLFVMPAEGIVFLALPGKPERPKAWQNGEELRYDPNRTCPDKPVAVVRWPRDLDEVAWPTGVECRELQKRLKEKMGYRVEGGQVLTATDVLALAGGDLSWVSYPPQDGDPPQVFVYCAKPWDFLVAGAIAAAAGAPVEQYDEVGASWKPAFPVDLSLMGEKAQQGKRVLFRVGWPKGSS
jgi:hypothetical protein